MEYNVPQQPIAMMYTKLVRMEIRYFFANLVIKKAGKRLI